MYKTEAERVIKQAIKETGAQFTEEQIKALSVITTKIADRIVEEALASMPSNMGSQGKRN
jgi:hypothetical protein